MSKAVAQELEERVLEHVEHSKSADSPRGDEYVYPVVEEKVLEPTEAFEQKDEGLLNECADQNRNFVPQPGVIFYERLKE